MVASILAVRTAGSVTGVDRDAQQLAAARAFVADYGLSNVQIVEADAFASALPSESFDFTHARFLVGPAGRADVLLPDGTHHQAGRRYRSSGTRYRFLDLLPSRSIMGCFEVGKIRTAFRRGGGDIDSGRQIYGMLRKLGLEEVRLRAAVIALYDRHPYMRLPVQFASSLRARIIGDGAYERGRTGCCCGGVREDCQ